MVIAICFWLRQSLKKDLILRHAMLLFSWTGQTVTSLSNSELADGNVVIFVKAHSPEQQRYHQAEIKGRNADKAIDRLACHSKSPSLRGHVSINEMAESQEEDPEPSEELTAWSAPSSTKQMCSYPNAYPCFQTAVRVKSAEAGMTRRLIASSHKQQGNGEERISVKIEMPQAL